MSGESIVSWGLLWRLIPLVTVAAIVGVAGQVRSLAALQGSGPPAGSRLGSMALVLVFGVAASWIGTAAAARIGLATPVLYPAAAGPLAASPWRHLLWGAAGGTVVACLFLPFYYGVMRPLFDPHAFAVAEAIRTGMGLPSRIAMGGVIEEVVYRWGALAVVAWLGRVVTGDVGAGVRWSAIAVSALLFGLGHLPGAAGLGIRATPALVAAALAANGFFGIVAGWLVWRHGLAAAMVAHATVHVLWSALEQSVLLGPAGPG